MRWLCLLFISVSLLSCKKAIENLQENYIIKIMVDGQWKVTLYRDNGVDRLSGFLPYSFQYHRDMTVDAIRDGAVETTGDWGGNVSNKTVWADFGSPGDPIELLNGTWLITNNTTTYVILVQETSGGTRQMRIDKI
jgi:hypothetical protein